MLVVAAFPTIIFANPVDPTHPSVTTRQEHVGTHNGNEIFRLVVEASAPFRTDGFDVVMSFDNAHITPVSGLTHDDILSLPSPASGVTAYVSDAITPYNAVSFATAFPIETQMWLVRGDRTGFHFSAFAMPDFFFGDGIPANTPTEIFVFYFRVAGNDLSILDSNSLRFESYDLPGSMLTGTPSVPLMGFTQPGIMFTDNNLDAHIWGPHGPSAIPPGTVELPIYNIVEEYVGSRTVEVATQTGTVTTGTTGTVTFAVTTDGIPAGTHDITITGLPIGVTVQGGNTIAIDANGEGTLTLNVANTVAAGTPNLTLRFDDWTTAINAESDPLATPDIQVVNVTSDTFVLTIDGAKTVSVGAQAGTMTATVAGTVTFPVTTTNIADGAYTVTVANLPTGVTVQGQVTIAGNSGILTLAGDTATLAGTTPTLTLTMDGATSPAFTLTIGAFVPIPVITGVVVTPSALSVQQGTSQQFAANVSGTGSPSYTVAWSVAGATQAGTTINPATGLLTVDPAEPDGTVLIVTANVSPATGSTTTGAASNTATVTVTAAPPPPVYGISLTPSAPHIFTPATVGYGAQAGHTVTILNTGNQTVTGLTITAPAGFTVSPVTIASLTPGSSAPFTITPNTGLGVDTHTGAVIVSGNAPLSAVSLNVSFTVDPVSIPTFPVTVTGSHATVNGAGNYEAGAIVTISAGTRNGFNFAGWTTSSAGVVFANASSTTTTFVMPTNAVTVVANWQLIDDGWQEPDTTPTTPTLPTPTPTTPTPAPTPTTPQPPTILVDEEVTIPAEEVEDVLAEGVPVIDHPGVSITIPENAIANQAEDGEDLVVGVLIVCPGDESDAILEVTVDIISGGNEITETDIPYTIVINLTELGLEVDESINPYRIVAIAEDGTLLGGSFDPETGVFTLETQYVGNFSIVYVYSIRRLRLQVGSYQIYDLTNNMLLQEMDVPTIIIHNRTVVPLRFVAYALDASDVNWNPITRTATLVHNNRALSLVIGELLPGMDVPAVLIDNRTMVPLRFVSEFFGVVVSWCPDTRTIEMIAK